MIADLKRAMKSGDSDRACREQVSVSSNQLISTWRSQRHEIDMSLVLATCVHLLFTMLHRSETRLTEAREFLTAYDHDERKKLLFGVTSLRSM